MKKLLAMFACLLCVGCASVEHKPSFVVHYDQFGRELLHNPNIPSCSKVTLKKDVKECVVR